MICGHTQSLDTVWVREYEIFTALICREVLRGH